MENDNDMLEKVLSVINKMTVEDYNKLYDKYKNKENVDIIFIDWTKYFNDKKIYLKRFPAENGSTCFGCYVFEKELGYKVCEKNKCVEYSKAFIFKKVIPLKRYMIR